MKVEEVIWYQNETEKWFLKNLLEIEINKTKAVMNEPVYLGPSVLGMSKIVMYECWYDLKNPKYVSSIKLFYMDMDIFTVKPHLNHIFKSHL